MTNETVTNGSASTAALDELLAGMEKRIASKIDAVNKAQIALIDARLEPALEPLTKEVHEQNERGNRHSDRLTKIEEAIRQREVEISDVRKMVGDTVTTFNDTVATFNSVGERLDKLTGEISILIAQMENKRKTDEEVNRHIADIHDLNSTTLGTVKKQEQRTEPLIAYVERQRAVWHKVEPYVNHPVKAGAWEALLITAGWFIANGYVEDLIRVMWHYLTNI